MFERFTEKARRVIFFAKYEASLLGAIAIEAEHILLGLIKEDKFLATHFFLSAQDSLESIRKEIGIKTVLGEKMPAFVELPLSAQAKSVLVYAVQEAEDLKHPVITTEHLFLGLLHQGQGVVAEILSKRDLNLKIIRDELIQNDQFSVTPSIPSLVAEMRTFARAILSKCDEIEAIHKENQKLKEKNQENNPKNNLE